MTDTTAKPSAGQALVGRVQQGFIGDKLTTAQSNLTSTQAQLQQYQQQQQALQQQLSGMKEIDPASGQTNQHYTTLQSQLQGINKQVSGAQSSLNTYQSQISDPTSMLSAQEREIVKGSQFGASVIGDGLSRMGDNEAIKDVLARQKDLSQGMNAQELQANRELMNQGINQAGNTQMRALQAQLSRAGVKGGVAGAQIRDASLATMSQKANVEKQLFVEDRAARENSLQRYAQNLGEVTASDIGQEQAEMNIVMQSGMGFAQLGSAERAAAMQAEAARQSAAAANAANCFTGDTEIEMSDGSYKRIDLIELGDELSTGIVSAIGKAYAFAPIYYYRGEYCTGSHVVFDNGEYRRVEDCEDVIETTLGRETIVYPMDVDNGFYYTKNGVKSWSFTEVEGSCDYKESLIQLNRRHLESNVSGLHV